MEDPSHIHSSWCLLISSVLLAITAVTCAALRSAIRAHLPPSLPVLALLDFLCGLELCVCGFELGVVLDIYDIPVYSVFLWLVICWQGVSWGESTANPGSHLLRWWRGEQAPLEGVVRSVAGALGGLSSLLVLAPLWAMELSHLHQGRAARSSAGACGDDLQVGLGAGLLVELAGTLVSGLAAAALQDSPRLQARPLTSMALDAALAVALVIAAFDLTGGYYSPVLATGIKLGCGTSPDHLVHLAVYWAGPMAGTLLAPPLYSRLVGSKQKAE